MYQNIWCEKRGGNQVEVHLWDDVAGYQNFIFKNYYYVRDGSGQYRSIYGDKLKKVTYWTEEDFKIGRVFESDIPLDTRILLDRYLDSDEPSKNHRENISENYHRNHRKYIAESCLYRTQVIEILNHDVSF